MDILKFFSTFAVEIIKTITPKSWKGNKDMTINCNNSSRKSVEFFNNGATIMVFALEEGQYWFTIGEGYSTEAGAKKAAVKKMAKHGYTFNEQEMANLKIR